MINLSLQRRLEALEQGRTDIENLSAWVTIKGSGRQLWTWHRIAKAIFENPRPEITEVEYLSDKISVVQEVARALLLKQL